MAGNIAFLNVIILVFCTSLASTNVSPTAGPFVELIGGVNPFRLNDVVTHRCTVIGGDPSPTFQWRCLNVIQESHLRHIKGQWSSEIKINLTEKVEQVYECACVVNHTSWNEPKISTSKPILYKTKPIIASNTRRYFTAKAGFPVTVRVGFYAIPQITGVVVLNRNYQLLARTENLSIDRNSSITFHWNNQILTSLGNTVSWRLNISNETDYGKYRMKVENNEGMFDFDFNITKKGPPSEPYNVTIYDVTSGGFMVYFEPGFDGGFKQSFAIRYWQREHSSLSRVLKFDSNLVRILNLRWSTEYLFVLYAENEKGRSVNSNVEPISVHTEDPGAGTHRISDVINGVIGFCVVIFVTGVIATFLQCRRSQSRSGTTTEMTPRSTINTRRGVYHDQAVFQRNQALPDAVTVDRLSNRKKQRRRMFPRNLIDFLAIKVPPILAVFRKSRLLPDNIAMSDVHDIISRSSSNVNGGDDNPPPIPVRLRAPVAAKSPALRRSSSMPAIQSNYPHFNVRRSESSTPTLPRQQRTNYSQVIRANRDSDDVGEDNDYGRIFFDSDTLPPSTYSEAPTLPMKKYKGEF